MVNIIKSALGGHVFLLFDDISDYLMTSDLFLSIFLSNPFFFCYLYIFFSLFFHYSVLFTFLTFCSFFKQEIIL